MAAPNGGGSDHQLRRRRNINRQSNITNNELFAEEKEEKITVLKSDTYWLTRIVFLRSLGFIYSVAFLVALHQNKALLGKSGLLPANLFLSQVKEQAKGNPFQCFVHIPSLLWLVNSEHIDFYLNLIAYAGLFFSLVVTITGAANMIVMLFLWILYHSIVNVGQRWYSFGWESQLLETGFLAIFFCPLWMWKQLPTRTPPSLVVIWGYRWLLFRIMIGAGLIKLRGDKCWINLTCMNYHYETQPVPNPISYYLHQTPELIHKFETLGNHFVELIVPWFAFLTRRFKITCGILQILFQIVLIISGNLSFLNWLTILPSIAFFDDHFLSILFSNGMGSTVWKVHQLQRDEKELKLKPVRARRVTNLSLGIALTYLSVPVVINLLSSRQQMNTSFEPLRIVNTYGAFGSITKVRKEVIFEGTYSNNPGDSSAEWKEYDFKCKPGNLTKMPCIISPYHYRLDWLMWFAAFQNYQYNPWLVHLAAKFLTNDKDITELIDYNPFEGKEPPKFIRAEHYRYSYTKIDSNEAKAGQWWTRKYAGSYLPPVSLDTLRPIIKQFGWKLR